MGQAETSSNTASVVLLPKFLPPVTNPEHFQPDSFLSLGVFMSDPSSFPETPAEVWIAERACPLRHLLPLGPDKHSYGSRFLRVAFKGMIRMKK